MNILAYKSYKTILSAFFAMVVSLLFLPACSNNSTYLIPEEIHEEGKYQVREKLDIQIKPIFTSGFKSEDREKYLFDFSANFTAIEIHFHNGTEDPVQWNPSKMTLKFGVNKEYKVLNEEEAFQYYKAGDLGGDQIVLLEKPYEQQKEDIENIKRFMIKPSTIGPGRDLSGLLLFKKIPLTQCENVQLIIGGIQVNQQEKMVKFLLECPQD